MENNMTGSLEIVSSQLQPINLPYNSKGVQDNPPPTLTVGAFFEYIKTAYKLNDNLEDVVNILRSNSELNWINLAQIQLSVNPETHSDAVEKSTPKNIMSVASIADETVNSIETSKSEEIPLQGTSVRHSCSSSSSSSVDELSNALSDTKGQYRTKSDCLLNVRNKYLTIGPLNKDDHDPSRTVCAHLNEASENKNWDGKLPMMDNQSSINKKVSNLREILKTCASDILHEGLLDSVLPYMLPRPILSEPIMKKTSHNVNAAKSALVNHAMGNLLEISSTESTPCNKIKPMTKSVDNEVEIHVCDEAKNIQKDFHCPQKLLVQSMRYFADVTAGQRLEEIDISVHCDVLIFEWLMRWVKKDIFNKSEWPVLEASNVIPIMVSASFLQMEPLLDYCVQYCYDNMSNILKTSTILTRLNDDLIARLADLYSNVDVEALKDKKDKIQSKLFCKLIVSLSNVKPECKKGHYSSLAYLFKCEKCGKIIIQSISELIPCIPNAMYIDSSGNVCSKHSRDTTWTLNDYILALRTELRSWRKVYWKLWGNCHFLFCRECGMHFPAAQMDWCSYHPEDPQFFMNETQKSIPSPLGRYPCCGQRAYKFQVLQSLDGCKYKEHSPDIEADIHVNTLNIINAYKDVISMEPPQLYFSETMTRYMARELTLRNNKLTCRESMWWDGLALVYPRQKFGLLGKIWGGTADRWSAQKSDMEKSSVKIHRQNTEITDASADSSPETDTDLDIIDTEDNGNSAGEDSGHSEESSTWSGFLNKCEKKQTRQNFRRTETSRRWFTNVPVRHNQDNQREFEEKATLQMTSLLVKRTLLESDAFLKSHTKSYIIPLKNKQPIGGSYVKVEAEFQDQWIHACKHKGSLSGKNVAHVKINKSM